MANTKTLKETKLRQTNPKRSTCSCSKQYFLDRLFSVTYREERDVTRRQTDSNWILTTCQPCRATSGRRERPEVTDIQKTPRTNRSYLPSRWCGVSGLSASPVTENTCHNTHYDIHIHYTLKMPVAARIIIHTHTVYLKQSFRTVFPIAVCG